ncbi:MAG: O-antigen ligase family protein [Desulfobacteraceae bacterium]|nr:O-antigen ligase family protein [Desulfobacteraceae bacterium]
MKLSLTRRIDVLPFCLVGLVAGLLPVFLRPLLALGICLGILAMVFILRNPRVGLFLVAGTIPLETVGKIGSLTANLPLTIPKIFTLASLVAWLINLALRRMTFRRKPWMYYLPGFLAAAAISLIGADETRSGFEALLRFSDTVIFFFLIVQLIDSEKMLKTCLIIFIIAGTGASSWSIIQRYLPGDVFDFRYGWEDQGARRGGVEKDIVEEHMLGGVVERSSGFSPHSILLAFNVGLFLAPLVALMGNTGRRAALSRLVMFGMSLILLASVVVTFARTGFVIVVFGLALMIGRGLIRLSPAKVMVAIAVGLVFVFAAPDKYAARVFNFKAYTTKSASIQIRIDILKGALGQFLDHPFSGVGYGNRYGIFKYFTTYPDKKHAVTPHNSYVQVASQTGLLGLVPLMLFFWQANRRLERAIRRFFALGRPDMARLGVGLSISLMIFLFAGLAIDLFDKGIAHAWMMIGASGAFILLADEAYDKSHHQLQDAAA